MSNTTFDNVRDPLMFLALILIDIVKSEHDDGRRAEHTWSRAAGGCCDNNSAFVITKSRVWRNIFESSVCLEFCAIFFRCQKKIFN